MTDPFEQVSGNRDYGAPLRGSLAPQSRTNGPNQAVVMPTDPRQATRFLRARKLSDRPHLIWHRMRFMCQIQLSDALRA